MVKFTYFIHDFFFSNFNELLIDDPNVIKRKLLRDILHYMPRAISADGNFLDDVDGVGLAAWHNEPWIRRRLVAGPNISTERDFVHIDEFGQMSSHDFLDLSRELRVNFIEVTRCIS